MQQTFSDGAGALTITQHAPGLLEVLASGRLSTEVGAAFPRVAREAAARGGRCSVFLDVRALDSFQGPVREAWVESVLEHRANLEAVVVLSNRLLVTLSARAAAVALSAVGVRFEVETDERRYLARRFQAHLEQRAPQ
jgi:hypothetical protein